MLVELMQEWLEPSDRIRVSLVSELVEGVIELAARAPLLSEVVSLRAAVAAMLDCGCSVARGADRCAVDPGGRSTPAVAALAAWPAVFCGSQAAEADRAAVCDPGDLASLGALRASRGRVRDAAATDRPVLASPVAAAMLAADCALCVLTARALDAQVRLAVACAAAERRALAALTA
jgi:hypothetical protein